MAVSAEIHNFGTVVAELLLSFGLAFEEDLRLPSCCAKLPNVTITWRRN
jgi:hypothetical protein